METVHLINILMKHFCFRRSDDGVEVFYDEINQDGVKIYIKLNENFKIKDSLRIVSECGNCGHKSSDGTGHDCKKPDPEPTTE